MSAYTAADIRSARSFLFVPGNRPERFDKAVSSGADIVVIDLEDAVAPADKPAAREHARTWLRAGNAAMVRVNGIDTTWHEDDLALITETSAAAMLPKAENRSCIARFGPAAVVVALIETAAGVAAAAEVCSAPGVQRVAFGSVDLGAQLAISPTDREAMLHARSSLVFASAAAGLAAPIDGVTTVLTDPQVTADDVTYARRLGLTAKLCIHPSQVATVHGALAPSDAEIAWARKVIAASDPDGAATAVDGQMVDRPVLLRAQGILDAVVRC